MAKSPRTTDEEKRPFMQAVNTKSRSLKQIILLFTCRIKLICLVFLCALNFGYFFLLSFSTFCPTSIDLTISTEYACVVSATSLIVGIKWGIVRKCPWFKHCCFLAYCSLKNCLSIAISRSSLFLPISYRNINRCRFFQKHKL